MHKYYVCDVCVHHKDFNSLWCLLIIYVLDECVHVCCTVVYAWEFQMKCVAQNNYIIQRWCRSSHLMSVFVWLTTQMYDDYKKQIEIATTIIMTTFESKRKQAVKSILFAWIRKSKTKYELFIEDLREKQERVRQRALISLIDVKIAQFCWMEIFECDWRKIFLNRMNSPASNLCIFFIVAWRENDI